jgi:hypothetical protein
VPRSGKIAARRRSLPDQPCFFVLSKKSPKSLRPAGRTFASIGACHFGVLKMATNLTPARLRLLASVMLLVCMQSNAATAPPASQRDGVHDFDFLIGDWKAHVRRLPDRRILTVCSSVNRVFFMTLSPPREPSSQRISWPRKSPYRSEQVKCDSRLFRRSAAQHRGSLLAESFHGRLLT